MLLGYRDLYVAGSFREVRPAPFWERVDSYIKKRFTGVERRTYRTFGYMTPEEVRYTAAILATPPGGLHAAPSIAKGVAPWAIQSVVYFFVVIGIIGFVYGVSTPTLTKTPQPQLAQNACASRPQPNPGVYARYDQSPSVAPLTLGTEAGSNYFVKINDAVSGRPILSFFAYGGSTLQAKVPAGSFVLKYAAGENWCGDEELFGALTEISEANRILQFEVNHGYKIDLIRRKVGDFFYFEPAPRKRRPCSVTHLARAR
jgi:hypothetical protein